jgi:hypothetical protein
MDLIELMMGPYGGPRLAGRWLLKSGFPFDVVVFNRCSSKKKKKSVVNGAPLNNLEKRHGLILLLLLGHVCGEE